MEEPTVEPTSGTAQSRPTVANLLVPLRVRLALLVALVVTLVVDFCDLPRAADVRDEHRERPHRIGEVHRAVGGGRPRAANRPGQRARRGGRHAARVSRGRPLDPRVVGGDVRRRPGAGAGEHLIGRARGGDRAWPGARWLATSPSSRATTGCCGWWACRSAMTTGSSAASWPRTRWRRWRSCVGGAARSCCGSCRPRSCC